MIGQGSSCSLLACLTPHNRGKEQGQLLKDNLADLGDLEDLKVGLQRLQEPYEITPGSKKYMPYILELDMLRYLPVAHIHHARDLKGLEYVASIQAQLLQVDRYLLDLMEGAAL